MTHQDAVGMSGNKKKQLPYIIWRVTTGGM